MTTEMWEELVPLKPAKYEVKFGVAGSVNTWTATYIARDFADAYEKALSTLAQNDDRHSYVQRIELW